MLSIAAICSGSVGPAEDILAEKMDPVEATEDILIEQMDGILDSVGDKNQDIGSKASSSDQSFTAKPTVKPTLTNQLIGVYSGFTAGASLQFLLVATLNLNEFSHNHISFDQAVALIMTWTGSIVVVSLPSWFKLWDVSKLAALFGAVLKSAGLIVLGPLPFQKTFTTILIGMVLHGAGQTASMGGSFTYTTYWPFNFGMTLGYKVGEALFSSGSITWDSGIRIIVFMEVVSTVHGAHLLR